MRRNQWQRAQARACEKNISSKFVKTDVPPFSRRPLVYTKIRLKIRILAYEGDTLISICMSLFKLDAIGFKEKGGGNNCAG